LHDRGAVPIHAQFGLGELTVLITFERDIVPIGARDAANWTVSDVGGARVVNGAVVQFDGKLQLTLNPPSGGAGPGLVTFDPPPFDILDVFDEPTQAFVDFPILPL